MTTVTITAGALPVNVISEKIIEDGRQRLENGIDRLEPGESQPFVLHAKQSIRLVEIDDGTTGEAA